MTGRAGGRGRGRTLFWTGALAGAAGVAAVLCAAFVLPAALPAIARRVPTVPPAAEAEPAGPAGERRLPIAGGRGTVILRPDGAAELETADGSRTGLLPPGPPEPDVGVVEARLAERLAGRPRPGHEPGRLVVLDKGVVEIPLSAAVTLQAADRLVTANADGTSSVYHADGRVEHRTARKSRE